MVFEDTSIADSGEEKVKVPAPSKISPRETLEDARETLAADQAVHFKQENEKRGERREVSVDDTRVSSELRREIEMMELDDSTKKEAEKKAEKISFLGEKEKIGHLLQLAREKGIVFAIQVARKMNEPYLLDILHDTLAQEGFYKKMGKPTDDDKKT